MGRLVIILRLLDEVLMHIEPFILKSKVLVIGVSFVVAFTITMVSHIALFYLIFNLEFGTL